MATGIKQLEKIQIGKETVRGTAVAATKLVAGKLDYEPEHVWFKPEDTLGVLSTFQRQTLIHKGVSLKYSGPAFFEQLLWWLGMGVKGGVTGVQQGATAAYLWTYSPNLTSGNVPDTYTVEYGNNQQAWRSEYCIARSMTLKMAPKEPWTIDVDMVARQIAENAFTGALTLVTGLEEPISTKAKLYIDPSWATLGSTLKSNVLVNCELTIPGFKALDTADGNDYFSTYGDMGRSITGKMLAVFTADTDTEFDNYRSGTGRWMRLITLGTLIAGSYYKTLQIDMAIKFDSFKILGEWEGQVAAEIEFHTVYDVTGAKEFEIVVQNALTAVP